MKGENGARWQRLWHTRIPYLSLQHLAFDIDGARCEFDTNGRFRINAEFIARETREHYSIQPREYQVL